MTSQPTTTEEINAAHQSERVTRCLATLNKAKQAQAAACTKLAQLKPTDENFDNAAELVAATTKLLISARSGYLNCARGI